MAGCNPGDQGNSTQRDQPPVINKNSPPPCPYPHCHCHGCHPEVDKVFFPNSDCHQICEKFHGNATHRKTYQTAVVSTIWQAAYLIVFKHFLLSTVLFGCHIIQLYHVMPSTIPCFVNPGTVKHPWYPPALLGEPNAIRPAAHTVSQAERRQGQRGLGAAGAATWKNPWGCHDNRADRAWRCTRKSVVFYWIAASQTCDGTT